MCDVDLIPVAWAMPKPTAAGGREAANRATAQTPCCGCAGRCRTAAAARSPQPLKWPSDLRSARVASSDWRRRPNRSASSVSSMISGGRDRDAVAHVADEQAALDGVVVDAAAGADRRHVERRALVSCRQRPERADHADA